MRVAIVAEWYPSPADPVLGIWAHRQALAARDAGAEVKVVAMRRPVPPLAALRALASSPSDAEPLKRWGRGGARGADPARRGAAQALGARGEAEHRTLDARRHRGPLGPLREPASPAL